MHNPGILVGQGTPLASQTIPVNNPHQPNPIQCPLLQHLVSESVDRVDNVCKLLIHPGDRLDLGIGGAQIASLQVGPRTRLQAKQSITYQTPEQSTNQSSTHTASAYL